MLTEPIRTLPPTLPLSTTTEPYHWGPLPDRCLQCASPSPSDYFGPLCLGPIPSAHPDAPLSPHSPVPAAVGSGSSCDRRKSREDLRIVGRTERLPREQTPASALSRDMRRTGSTSFPLSPTPWVCSCSVFGCVSDLTLSSRLLHTIALLSLGLFLSPSLSLLSLLFLLSVSL